MSKFLLVTVSAFLVAFIGVSATFDAKAADTMAPTQSRHQAASANRYCQDLWRCSPTAAAIGTTFARGRAPTAILVVRYTAPTAPMAV
jgi:hypothetical protein